MRSDLQHRENYAAGMACLCGVVLHILLSDPLLNTLGIHYSGEGGRFYEKIHPGTVLYFFAFFLLLCEGNPAERFIVLCRQNSVFMALLLLYMLLFFYMGIRSGFAGLAFIMDTHMSAVLCALVFSHAPKPLCRTLVHLFVTAALLNAAIGVAEAWGQFRIFAFDPQWPVLHEEHFRASAFLGHPLDNAVFTTVALFVAMAFDYSRLAKIVFTAVFMAALIAFSGRAGFAFSLAGLAALFAINTWKKYVRRQMTFSEACLLASACILAPLCLGTLFYFLLHHGVGQHLKLLATWDASADSRRLAFRAFSFMHAREMVFGVPAQRIMDIVYRMNLMLGVDDIENPWVMMCMSLGIIMFSFWCLATIAFIYKLMENKPVALQLAVIAYFIIASTSNSFGRKDANYALMVSAVLSAAKALR